MVRRLAPRTCEGGVPALAQGRGEYEFPATERQIELSFCVCCSSSHAFVKDMRMTGSPRYQCAHWYHPPHKCGGQGRVPHPPTHHCPNSSTNSNLPRHRTIPSGSGRERKQTTFVTTWLSALPTNSNLPRHKTIPSGSGRERKQTTFVTTWLSALPTNSNLSFRPTD